MAKRYPKVLGGDNTDFAQKWLPRSVPRDFGIGVEGTSRKRTMSAVTLDRDTVPGWHGLVRVGMSYDVEVVGAYIAPQFSEPCANRVAFALVLDNLPSNTTRKHLQHFLRVLPGRPYSSSVYDYNADSFFRAEVPEPIPRTEDAHQRNLQHICKTTSAIAQRARRRRDRLYRRADMQYLHALIANRALYQEVFGTRVTGRTYDMSEEADENAALALMLYGGDERD